MKKAPKFYHDKHGKLFYSFRKEICSNKKVFYCYHEYCITKFVFYDEKDLEKLLYPMKMVATIDYITDKNSKEYKIHKLFYNFRNKYSIDKSTYSKINI